MPRIISKHTGQTVRIGDKIVFPGGAPVEITAFSESNVGLKYPTGETSFAPFALFGLEWTANPQPWELMTDGDWIHATNIAKETGGHFASNLARAYQHADSSNRAPIRRADVYQRLFFGFLSRERARTLAEQAEKA